MSNAGASLATCYGPVSAHMMSKAENIRLLILDVDGVLSDGLIYMGNNGEELKAFNVRDGYGIRCALTSGIEVAIITGRKAKLVEDRCETLGIADVMTPGGIRVRPGTLAVDVLNLMQSRHITSVMVADGDQLLGVVHMHDLLRAGVV